MSELKQTSTLERDGRPRFLQPGLAVNLTSKHPLLSKLPEEPEEMIRWMATEPSPIAKLMDGINIYETDVVIRGSAQATTSHRATVVEADSAEFLHTWPINRVQNHLSYTRRYFHNAFLCLGSRQKRNKKVLINALPDGWEVSADLGRHPTAQMIDDWYWNWDEPIPRQLLKFNDRMRYA